LPLPLSRRGWGFGILISRDLRTLSKSLSERLSIGRYDSVEHLLVEYERGVLQLSVILKVVVINCGCFFSSLSIAYALLYVRMLGMSLWRGKKVLVAGSLESTRLDLSNAMSKLLKRFHILQTVSNPT